MTQNEQLYIPALGRKFVDSKYASGSLFGEERQ